MSGSTQSFIGARNQLLAAAMLLALTATFACTRSNASAGAPHAASQASQQTKTSKAQAEQPVPTLAPELAETFAKAQSGDVYAKTRLAEAYEKGEGATKDIHQAVTWFTKAADAGDSNAMYRLGRIYATGSGVEKDYVEAFSWYKRGARAGNTDAMYSLGEAYEHGTGVREDIQQAVNWYDQATLRGNKAAKAALERLGESFDR